MKIQEALAVELVSQGVNTIFTLPGDETVLFAGHAEDRDIRVLAGRHEAATVGMADGYFRATGKVGVVVLARGPGLTNALTAIICATRARSGVLVVVGDSSPILNQMAPDQAWSKDLSHKYVPQESLLEAAMVDSISLWVPATAVADMRAAFDWAKAGRTIVVNVSQQVMAAEAGDLPATVRLPSFPSDQALPPDRVVDLADQLARHERIVILAGRGAVRSEAGHDLRRLAQATGALLATSLLAKGYFADEPFDAGVVGTFATPVAADLIADADLLLAFGVSLNPKAVFDREICPRAKVIQIDNEPEAFGRFTPVDMEIVADARLAAAQLADAVETQVERRTGYRTSENENGLAASKWGDEIEDHGELGAMDPRLLMLRLDELLPERRVVVVDSGKQSVNPLGYLSASDANSFLFPHDGGSLGAAIGVGIGACVGRTDRLTVVCLGDVALMMSLSDFETAVRYRLPMLVVVTNNGGYAKAMTMLNSENLPDGAGSYDNPSFESVARGLGAEAMTINLIEDLSVLPARLDGLTGPLLLDCRTSSHVIPIQSRRRELVPEQAAN